MIKTHARIALGVSFAALAAGLSNTAQAQAVPSDSGMTVEDYTDIVVTDGIDLNTPAPEGALDNTVDVTGVGQMVTKPDPTSFAIGLCTGTLINPRTVLFAAHCVNDAPAESYGASTGGIPMSFGFSADNFDALIEWIGLGGSVPFQTHTDLNIYNVEQVWYDERSVELGFLEADIALATLDTHADGVPTWTMLFSPLEDETHVFVNGYGRTGHGSNGDTNGIDFRRRIAENVVSVLGSLEDRNDWLFGEDDYGLPQNLYMPDFDSPGGEATYDFDVFDGPAVPREGTTAGGDSGGPLIADEAFDRSVVLGTLSGGSRFFAGQPFSSYGTHSFYQPLFMFWETIVANNSYAYVSARPGVANWNNPNHWVQTMDSNYAIAVDGALVNATPGFSEPGVTGETPQFGDVCYYDDCYDLGNESVPLASGPPNSVYVPGGPGTTHFVPDNVTAIPVAGVKARYYEVTLDAFGSTILGDSKTIDRLNIGGLAQLAIRTGGNLKVWGDYTQTGGILSLDGTLTTGEAFLGNGVITGSGLFDPTYLTNVHGLIAPGDIGRTGTLTVAGDVILSSAATTLFDLQRSGGDLLAVIGDDDNEGIASLGGTAAFLMGGFGHAPRYGQSFVIVAADGGVEEEFDDTVTLGVGVLYPALIYNENNVIAQVRARSFRDFLFGSGVTDRFALAFGSAFDGLRANSYADLADVFGTIDVMGVSQLANTFGDNSAVAASELSVADEAQGSYVRRLVSDRLSLLGQRGTNGRISLVGTAAGLGGEAGLSPGSASQLSFAQSYQPREWQGANLPENMSGFVSTGYRRLNDVGSRGESRDLSGTWHMAAGLEFALGESDVLGTAFGYSRGQRQVGGALAHVATSQAAIYGSHQLGGGVYLGGQASIGHSTLDSDAQLGLAESAFAVDSHALSYAAELELGYNHRLGGLTLTPRTSIGYSAYEIAGFQDERSPLGIAVDGIARRGVDWRTGLRLAGSTRLGFAGGWRLQPQLQLDYVKRLGGNDTRIDLRFLSAAELGVSLPVGLHDASYGEMRGGLELTNGRLSYGAAVETRIGQQFQRDDRMVTSVSYRF